eukprot:scaffold30360_cov18-Prasinocladus_malaysianus.AAC.1
MKEEASKKDCLIRLQWATRHIFIFQVYSTMCPSAGTYVRAAVNLLDCIVWLDSSDPQNSAIAFYFGLIVGNTCARLHSYDARMNARC